jgi:hypothetical protein
MPANNIIIPPRAGHIDLPDDLLHVAVALSAEKRTTETGAEVTILHLDVASGNGVETPFSVGIPLADSDLASIMAAFAGVTLDPPRFNTWGNPDTDLLN